MRYVYALLKFCFVFVIYHKYRNLSTVLLRTKGCNEGVGIRNHGTFIFYQSPYTLPLLLYLALDVIVWLTLPSMVISLSQGMTYPELQRDPNKICYVLDQEEKQFSKTLKKGQKFLLKTFEKLGPEKVLPGIVLNYKVFWVSMISVTYAIMMHWGFVTPYL